MDSKKKIFIRCCYGYAVSGMAVLVIGAILPSLIEETGMSFLAAGGLLSALAIGNLMSSLIFPALERFLGRRIAVVIVTGVVPLSFYLFTLLPPLPVLYLLIFFTGASRGSVTIVNNAIVNQITGNSPKMLNLLHCSFALGAFLSPFLTAVMTAAGFGWRHILYLLIVVCFTSVITYATMEYKISSSDPVIEKDAGKSSGSGYQGFLKSVDFYSVALLLFFYVGMENCVNGWFVTYLQNTGIMSSSFATTLVSITWLVIMAGRIFCASISNRFAKHTMILISCLGTAVCFLLMISTKNIVAVTLSLAGFGFCLSGIYPTCIAEAGTIIKDSTWGLSLLTAVASVGGILTPQIVGGAADRLGIVAAISVLAVNAGVMIVISILYTIRKNHCTNRAL